MNRFDLRAVLILASLFSIVFTTTISRNSKADTSSKAAVSGFDLTNLDKSCKPCEDFFQYASGGWIANNPIPAAFPRWGNFQKLAEKNVEVLRQILEEKSKEKGLKKGTNEQKISDLYCSCMDTEKIEADTVNPLLPELKEIDAIKDKEGLQTQIAKLHTYGIAVVFRTGGSQDLKDVTKYIAFVDQSGIGLPDRDYYFNSDEKSKKIRDEYTKHVAKMFELLGDKAESAEIAAKTVMSIESKLAEGSMTRTERRNPDARYNKMSLAKLQELAPNVSWNAYFATIGLKSVDGVNVVDPNFFKTVNKLVEEVSLSDWKTYLKWHLVNAAAPSLSSKFVDQDFYFKETVIKGTKENLPRWRRCVAATDRMLGEALGQFYVERSFTPEAKTRALEMVKNLRQALRVSINNLDWMSEPTRKEALAKLDLLVNKIGYPDKWRDYSALEIDRSSYFRNLIRGANFSFKENLAKIGKPVDKSEWFMSPPTVNAYYSATMSEIVFPAGILQPPFFNPAADDAVNYGGIGAVIGHELTHGFDDQGRKFDFQGNLKDWWTPEDEKNYKERADCVEKQFSNFVVDGDLHINGKLVLGESIADLGGLKIAYAAFQKSLEGKEAKVIDGFTPQQRFFLGWAQVWSSSLRPEFLRLMVTTDPHPAPKFRVNGPLSNMPEFAKAFSCQAEDKMVNTKQCQIW